MPHTVIGTDVSKNSEIFNVKADGVHIEQPMCWEGLSVSVKKILHAIDFRVPFR